MGLCLHVLGPANGDDEPDEVAERDSAGNCPCDAVA
jgi:hypothetical protein